MAETFSKSSACAEREVVKMAMAAAAAERSWRRCSGACLLTLLSLLPLDADKGITALLLGARGVHAVQLTTSSETMTCFIFERSSKVPVAMSRQVIDQYRFAT
jgi:hypothetical protein